MHIIFINYNNFIGNSGIHIHPLANEISAMGYKVSVFIPDEKNEPTFEEAPNYNILSFNEKNDLKKEDDIIFIAWTPREIVRKTTIDLVREYNAPYYVHLEDNEEQLLADNFRVSYSELKKKKIEDLDLIISSNLSHPYRYKDFLAGAIGVTCIIDTLEEFVPTDIPSLTFWPSCEKKFFNINGKIRQDIKCKLKIDPVTKIIFYPGNMHDSNACELTNLYKAIKILNDTGIKVCLVRTGENFVPFKDRIDITNVFYKEMGSLPLKDNIKFLLVADILVQPGIDNQFNRYRFPSKLPMFLASGKPVILADSNIGKHLEEWKNCIKFVTGRPEELAHKIILLFENHELAVQIGIKGREYAIKNFSWENSALKLIEFLKRTGGIKE